LGELRFERSELIARFKYLALDIQIENFDEAMK
jgi:hypothetical protein